MTNRCGGCEGLGAHSPRCHTQPGWQWKRRYDFADSLGDDIGAADPVAANMAYTIAARMKKRWLEAKDGVTRVVMRPVTETEEVENNW